MIHYNINGFKISEPMKEEVRKMFNKFKKFGNITYLSLGVDKSNFTYTLKTNLFINDNNYIVEDKNTDFYKSLKNIEKKLKSKILKNR